MQELARSYNMIVCPGSAQPTTEYFFASDNRISLVPVGSPFAEIIKSDRRNRFRSTESDTFRY